MWILNFYQEIVGKMLHRYFPYHKKKKKKTIPEALTKKLIKAKKDDTVEKIEELDNQRSWNTKSWNKSVLTRYLTPEQRPYNPWRRM